MNSNSNLNMELDINNYTLSELQQLFGLNNNYNFDELISKERVKSQNIITSENLSIDYKNDLLDFIKTAKQILSYKFMSNLQLEQLYYDKYTPQPQNNPKEEQPITDLNKQTNNIGKIINPLSNHQTLQTQSLPSNNISGYGIKTEIQNVVFNTQFRNNYFTTTSSDCEFILPIKFKNITSITLSALQLPNVIITFSSQRKTNQLYIKEDITNNEAIVVIPNGNYTIDEFPSVLEEAINIQVNGGDNRFTVSINKHTHFTTISNSTYSFTMNIIKKDGPIKCVPGSKYTLNNPDKESANPKNPDIQPSMILNSMGYFIGYRNPEYNDKMSYTSESMFDTTFTDYIYFVLNDYNNNFSNVVTAILPNFSLTQNILSVIPITSNQFDVTFLNGADLIYKTRKYFTPVNLSKISIQMLDQYGQILNLHQTDYAFSLQFETLYNISGGDNFSII